jgi:hypothetical protein
MTAVLRWQVVCDAGMSSNYRLEATFAFSASTSSWLPSFRFGGLITAAAYCGHWASHVRIDYSVSVTGRSRRSHEQKHSLQSKHQVGPDVHTWGGG